MDGNCKANVARVKVSFGTLLYIEQLECMNEGIGKTYS